MGFTFNEFPWSKYYDSDLREVLKYMKEVEAYMATFQETIDDLRQALADISGLYERVGQLEQATSDLGQIRSEIATLQVDVTNLVNRDNVLQKEIDDIMARIRGIDEDFREVYSYIDTVIKQVVATNDRKYYQLQTLVNIRYAEVIALIDELARRVNDIDTSVINPWHTDLGRVSNQKNTNIIYNELADEIPTAEEYVRVGLTANAYTALDISAREYAEFGKAKIHFYWVYSPTFGWRQEINNVLTSIVNEVMDTLTANEYTALDLDADQYTALDMTAFEYYNYNTDRGYLKLGGSGITAEQYTTITT